MDPEVKKHALSVALVVCAKGLKIIKDAILWMISFPHFSKILLNLTKMGIFSSNMF
jgi:hypothetical protein